MAIGRNTLAEAIVAAFIGAAGTYTNLTGMTAANVKYGTSRPENIKAVLLKDRKFISVIPGETVPDPEYPYTIGGHQVVIQTIGIFIFIHGADTETDQKLAVTLAEEAETLIYNTRTPTTGWNLIGWERTTPDVWGSGRSHVVRTFYMEFLYRKVGTEGVP